MQAIWESYLEDCQLREAARHHAQLPNQCWWLRNVGASACSSSWWDASRHLDGLLRLRSGGQHVRLSTVERATDFAVYPNPRTVGFGIRLTY